MFPVSRFVFERLVRIGSIACLVLSICLALKPLLAADPVLPVVDVESQPLKAAVQRVVQALEYVGSPLPTDDVKAIAAAVENTNGPEAVAAIQKTLDKHCLAMVNINPESRVKVVNGPAKPELTEQGWRTFLVKVHNEARINPELRIASPNSAPNYQQGKGSREKPQSVEKLVTAAEAAQRFLDIQSFTKQPLAKELSGLECEYRVVQLYSRDKGRREATLVFDVGQGTQDLGFRNETAILFECVPSCQMALHVRDENGAPTTAAFTIRDRFGRVYPNTARRLAPDFFFHEQIYRADGETVSLPAGEYTVSWSRGPEYVVGSRKVTIPEGAVSHAEAFRLERWVHPKMRGWFSGDHHVHAAGCAHYDSPTEGVGPTDMMRHLIGEDLNVGCVLTWGPCWYTQKRYFEGKTSAISTPQNLMRYDIEVSGFPSSHAGHLCLLRLQEDDYPGTTQIEEWPSWTQPVLQWGRDQGGIVGYSHSGWGLGLPDVMPDGSRKFSSQPWGGAPNGWQGKAAATLPDYAMPKFDGIGANEYVVTGANDVCDFISAVDTPVVWELNVWYHTLNCGVTTRISGETDFPCIYGERVGLGRIYVKQPTDKPLDFDAWSQGIKDGRSYCTDGLSHLFDFKVNDLEVGELGTNKQHSRVALAKPGKVRVTCDAAALLAEKPTEATERIRNARLDSKPYWHVERARVGDSRQVPVELIVNGEAVAKKMLDADGRIESLSFDVDIPHSSWVALRIFPTCHTNPIWVDVDNKPVRASKRSAKWCREAVDVCWKAKEKQIRESERPAARKAYDQAAAYYEKALAESAAD